MRTDQLAALIVTIGDYAPGTLVKYVRPCQEKLAIECAYVRVLGTTDELLLAIGSECDLLPESCGALTIGRSRTVNEALDYYADRVAAALDKPGAEGAVRFWGARYHSLRALVTAGF